MSTKEEEEQLEERSSSNQKAPTPSPIPSAGADDTSQASKRGAAFPPPQQPGYAHCYQQRGYGYPAAQYGHPSQYPRHHATSSRGTSYPQHYASRHPPAPVNYPYQLTNVPSYGSVRPAYISPPNEARRRDGGKRKTPHHGGGVSSSPASSIASKPTISSPAMSKPFDSSLGQLTKRFVEMLKAAPNQTIDLNYAVAQLKIQKRRIYDITNVLEGVGLIMKVENNNVAWCSDSSAVAPQFEGADSGPYGQQHPSVVEAKNPEAQSTKKEERQLQQYLEMLKARAAHFPLERHPSQVSSTAEASAASDSQNQRVLPHGVSDARPHMYVPYSSITELPMFDNDTVIGVRAPIGTSVDVPDPEQSARNGVPRYQLYMNSKTAESQDRDSSGNEKTKAIDVYLMRPQVLPGDPREVKESKGSKVEEPMKERASAKESSKRKSPDLPKTVLPYKKEDDYEPQPAFRHVPSHQVMPHYWGPTPMPVWGHHPSALPPHHDPRLHQQHYSAHPQSYPPESQHQHQQPQQTYKRPKTSPIETTPQRERKSSSGAVSASSLDNNSDSLGDIFGSPFRGHAGGSSSDWQGSWNTPGRPSSSSSLVGSSGSFGGPATDSPNLLRSELYDIGMSPHSNSNDCLPPVYMPSEYQVPSPAPTQDADFSLPGIHGEEIPQSTWHRMQDAPDRAGGAMKPEEGGSN